MTTLGRLQSAPRDEPGITQLLSAWREGNAEALAQLTPLVYGELYRVARAYLASERDGHILQPTALVNEAFLRLLAWQPPEWRNRAQFYGVSANLMRRVLIQFARERRATKRGGDGLRVSLSEVVDVAIQEPTDLIELDDALTELEALDPRQARIVELRFFAGLSLEEAANVLQISVSTVRRDFRVARAWLRMQLTSAA